MKLRGTSLILCAVVVSPVLAQGPAWDTSGNSLLNGSFYFRQVVYVGNPLGTPSLSSATAAYGGINFDGNGHWTISGGQLYSSNTSAPQGFSASGTYSISAAGFGLLTSPANTSQQIYVMVSKGVIIGATTENTSGNNDLFVAAQLASPQPTVSSLNGTYQMAWYATAGDGANDVDALIQMSSTGAGQVNLSMNGYNGAGSTATQISNSLSYIYANGAAKITFPKNSNAPFIGTNSSVDEYVYMSPDGNFIFGGAPNDFDMFVGVKTGGSAPNLSGLYYQAGLDEDDSQISSNVATLHTWFGSFNAVKGNITGHQRLAVGDNNGTGYTYYDSYPTSISGSGYTNQDTYLQYVFSQNAAIRIGLGQGPYLGINVALQAPTMSATGVYLDPQGVTNSASSAPFTAGVSNGEFITLYGSNLAQNTVVAKALPFPTSLGNVQVSINGYAAPIYFVSSTQVSVIVPFENTFSIAQIQVTNNGTKSNIVTVPVNQTTPGVFTIDSSFGGLGPGGLGYAAAEHADYRVVSDSNPAQPGETIQLYVTGLGTVYPPNPDGAAGPTGTLSQTTNTFTVDFGGTAAPTPAFVGLAPALAGLYQINVQVPTGLSSGKYPLGIYGPDSYTNEAVIPVGTATSSTSSTASPLMRPHAASRFPHVAQGRPMVVTRPLTNRAPITSIR